MCSTSTDRSNTSKPGSLQGRAAVLVAVAGGVDEQQLLLTLRANHLNSHRGEVAFPGGKWEADDKDLLATALRESEEEVGLLAEQVDVIGELDYSFTRTGMPVKPYIAQVNRALDLRANKSEIDAFFWAPLTYFVTDQRERTDIFRLNGREHWAPVYLYNDYKIWGFTARVIVEMVNRYCGVKIARQHPSPEVIFNGAKKEV